MGTNVRPNIVTNGLVLALDAANIKSYPRTGTTWNNLVNSSISGSLVNSPTFNSLNGGSIVFNGTNQYVDNIGNVSNFSFIQNTGIYTISTWVKPSLSNKEMYICGNNSGTAAQKGFYFGTTSTDIIIIVTRGSFGVVVSLAVNGCFLNTTDWVNVVIVGNGTTNQFYRNGVIFGASSNTSTLSTGDSSFSLGIGFIKNATTTWLWNGNISNTLIYNRALTASEIQQNYNALKSRFAPTITQQTPSPYESLTYIATGTITLTNNGTDNVSMFKTSGTSAWDSHFYSTTPFTAPCTIEFNKQAGATDNGTSYAMISWNADPTLDASYTSLDYASYPYATNNYVVYNNGSVVQNGGTWSTANRFYIVYDTDGFIRHYNGATLLYSVNSGTGRTVYVDSSLYSVNATFGGFSNVRVRRNSWNGTSYV